MRKLMRLVVLLAVALAVPVQGVAAAAADPCMASGHHGTTDAAAHDHPDGDRGHAAQGGHGHATHDDRGHAVHGCAHCAACCAGVALGFFNDILLAKHDAESPRVVAPAPFAGIAAQKLDRPPRPILA